MAAGNVHSPPHLSLEGVHRRGWGSLYAALSKGGIDAQALRELLASRSPGKGGTPVYAVDVSPWPRCDAQSSPGRCYLYHPSRHSVGQPIVAGWAYQLVARLGFERDSWATPVDVRRVEPEEEANEVGGGRRAGNSTPRPAAGLRRRAAVRLLMLVTIRYGYRRSWKGAGLRYW